MKFILMSLVSILFSMSVMAEDGLRGKINGQAWSFKTGAVKAYNGNYMRISLWESQETDACNVWFPSSPNKVEASVPFSLGSHRLNEEDIVVLSYVLSNGMPWNIMVESGVVTIHEITKEIVVGSIDVHYNNKNFISGTFTVPNCN